MKNYVGFVNDHSGSMDRLKKAAIQDYNANIAAIKDAASDKMLDTIVSVVGIGVDQHNKRVERQVVISNPHVLKPITNWVANGWTPLYDGIGNMIELFQSLPDYHNEDVSFLVIVTTDGDENNSRDYNKARLSKIIYDLQKTGRWTFVCRVPKGMRQMLAGLNVPAENIQEWETTDKGMAASTAATTTAMNNYYTSRAAGSKSSTTFYADATKVDTSVLTDVSKTEKISLYVVADDQMGMEIRNFILTKRMDCLKGSAFYQLTKTEARVGHDKMILIRDRATGAIYAGAEARKMIGLPTDKNARLHPGDHGNYDIFIQSFSTNRKLVAGTGVLYWKRIGTTFTQEELDRYKPKDPVVAEPVAKPVVVLPKVEPTNKPTPSPIPKKKKHPMVSGKPVEFFPSREAARQAARGRSTRVGDGVVAGVQGPNQERWFAFL